MFLDDLILAGENRRPVDFHILHLETKLFRSLEVIVDIGMVQKHFGRDAADVQACPAEKRVLFDDGGLQTPLRGPNRRNVSAGTTADNHQVIFSQSNLPPVRIISCALYRRMSGYLRLFPGQAQTVDFNSHV